MNKTVMSEKRIVHPLPIREEWHLGVTRELFPVAIISTKTGTRITELNPDSHDAIVGVDVLRHLVECHNARVRDLNRKRKGASV